MLYFLVRNKSMCVYRENAFKGYLNLDSLLSSGQASQTYMTVDDAILFPLILLSSQNKSMQSQSHFFLD